MQKNSRDIEILRDGPICLYHNSEILNKDLSWLSDHNFEIFDIDCRTWTKKNFHKKVKDALFFPGHYGENLNAFHDCLSDMLNKKYKGLVLVFTNFDNLVEQNRPAAEGVLNSIAQTSREWLIDEHKLICLIQSNDPDLHFPELGGLSPSWNGAEWLDEERRKSTNTQ